MDLGLFATQTVNKGQALSGGSSALTGNGLGNVLGGVDFWNAILGNLGEIANEENGQIKSANANDQKPLDPEILKKEKADLALLQLALLGQDPDQSIDEKLSELRIERIANNPENKIEQLTKLIDHLTSGLPEVAAANNLSVEELVSRLSKRLEKLEASLESFRSGDFGDQGAPFQALIATGLNPSQLTTITNRIEEVETKLGRELTVEDLIAGVGNIIPAPGTTDEDGEPRSADAIALLLQNRAEASEEFKAEEKEEIQKEEQAYVDFMMPTFTDPKANNVEDNIVRATQVVEKISTLTNVPQIAQNGLNLDRPQTATRSTTNTPDIMTPSTGLTEKPAGRISNAEFQAMFSKGNNFGVENAPSPALGNKAMAAIKNVASLPTLPQTGDVVLSSTWMEALPSSNILSELAGFDIQSGTPFNNVMQAVAHVTAATSQAGQTHPATSMVAAHVSKAAQSGEARNITLNLDPPELGRVEIRLQFGAEKTVKANLIVEKPETLLMLQRDMSALEKALQDAGLDTSGDSVNYEMASEGYDFNSNREGNSQNGGTGSGEDGENTDEELALIETTMTWDVDPETGHVHYNILA